MERFSPEKVPGILRTSDKSRSLVTCTQVLLTTEGHLAKLCLGTWYSVTGNNLCKILLSMIMIYFENLAKMTWLGKLREICLIFEENVYSWVEDILNPLHMYIHKYKKIPTSNDGKTCHLINQNSTFQHCLLQPRKWGQWFHWKGSSVTMYQQQDYKIY